MERSTVAAAIASTDVQQLTTKATRHVARAVAGRVQEARVDAGAAADGVDQGQCGRAFRWRARQRIADPGQRDDVPRVDGRRLCSSVSTERSWEPPGTVRTGRGAYHEHHAEIARTQCRRRCCKHEGHDGPQQRQRDVPVPLARLIRVHCVEVTRHDSQNVRRCSQPEKHDVAVIQRGHHSREEGSHRAAGNNPE